jgi:hypothetical protein
MNKERGSVLHALVMKGQLSCVQLLVKHGADVNGQAKGGLTPLISSMHNGDLSIAQCLLDQKADVHYRASEDGYVAFHDEDALHCAMCMKATVRTPGIVFSVLSCNTDIRNIEIEEWNITTTMRDAHIEEYEQVQAYIDEYHHALRPVLFDHVPVDTRVGRGDRGIYQEPLERVLEYLGMSMNKDQVVNASIDGEEGVRRALIPGHLLNAEHWFDKFKNR